MLAHISPIHLRKFIITNKIKVCSLLSFIYSANFATYSPELTKKNDNFNHSNLGSVVFSKYSRLLVNKDDEFNAGNASVNELLLRISHVCPGITRKYFGIYWWKPEDVVDLLLGFETVCRKTGFDAEVVGCLWEVFKRVGFNEKVGVLAKSVEVMGFMFIDVGMFSEVEELVYVAERRGILMGGDGIYSGLIEGYVNGGELEKGLLVYDKMKERNSGLSVSCYRLVADVLLKEGKRERVIGVFEDVVKAGFEFGDVETRNLEKLISALCWDGKIEDVRKLLRMVVGNGWKPSSVVLREVTNVYCEKRDFDDILSFFAEMKCVPDVLVGNKVIQQLCSIFGVDRADLFLWELEQLGFSPNEITYGIFICHCCRDRKLRHAFCYLSEIFTRGLKPDRHSYNALISSMFKADAKAHARDIFNDMIDNGIKPDLTTFRTLLAGYSQAREFNEVKLLIKGMAGYGLVHLSPSEDLISQAFCVLGLDPLTVMVKRDNDLRNYRTEFWDELGNGLYLVGNLMEFERTVTGILEDSLVPDFSLQVMKQCDSKNEKEIVLKLEEMGQWGQEVSASALSTLVRLLCDSDCDLKLIPRLLDNMSLFFNKLDHETVNLVIQTLCEKGFVNRGKKLFVEMHRRHLPVTNTTYNSVLIGVCKRGKLSDIVYCLNLARKGNWLPKWKDFAVVSDSLCPQRMLKELLQLFDIVMISDPDCWIQICDTFLEKLCSAGFTSVGHILINELRQNYELDHILYNHLIKGYSREKKNSEFLMIYDTFLRDTPALSSDIILTLVPQLCKANRFDHAVSLKDTCLKEYPYISCSIFSALVNGYCEVDRIKEADDLILEMFGKNVLPNAEIFDSLLQRHCKTNDLKTVNELFCSMIRRRISLPLSSYRTLLCLLCRKGLFHSAFRLKRFMLLEQNLSYSIIYNILMFYLFRTANQSHVNSLLNELEGTGMKLDEVGHNILVHGFSVCKDSQRSLGHLYDMIMKGFKPSNRSLRTVIRYLCSIGQVQNALDLSNQIELKGWEVCSSVHYELVEGLVTDGRIIEAERFVAEILEKGQSFDSIYYNNLVRKFGQYGKLETAVSLLDAILKSGSIPDSSSYDCIVQMFCDHADLDRAMNFLTEMLHRNLKPSLNSWDLLIDKFCGQGRTIEAERLLILMVKVDEIPTRRMYSSVIERYRLENNLSKASELLHSMQQYGYKPDFSTQWSVIRTLSNSGEPQRSNDSQGFLSKLLGGSGFLTGERIRPKCK